jgi:restriction system protein
MSNRYNWSIEIRHEGLKKYRLVRGSDKYVVEQMAQAQQATWNEMWKRRLAADQRRQLVYSRDEKKRLAAEKTVEAKRVLDDLRNLLSNALTNSGPVKWDALEDVSSFRTPKPTEPVCGDIPDAPMRVSAKYQPRLSLIDRIIWTRAESFRKQAEGMFQHDYSVWENDRDYILEKFRKEQLVYAARLKEWEESKKQFKELQEERNRHVGARKLDYLNGTHDGILDNCELVLSSSSYPDAFPQEFDLDYNPETKILIVDYLLPPIESFPRIKEIKYVQTRDAFDEVSLSQTELTKLYDDALYQIALRSIHELYTADIIEALQAVIFNGWVNSIDKGNGQSIKPCVLTVQVSRVDFQQINLALVDAKTCFKALKGIASPKLHTITPVAPIMKIDRQDRRFVASYEVTNSIDDATNLAAMDWEDFEHLVRELFEKEFAQAGGEVKVTRASRDWGVDAVVFDPDPIRGGKIVIQAKRYTNTVDVSAVRDLYGTVINEGAAKGILVTTADFGPESHEFAKGKPITLLNGNNLLHLLSKHGHHAKIDLKEARRLLAEEKRNFGTMGRASHQSEG